MKEFTEDEKVIAKNMNKKYTWMARNKNGSLFVTDSKPIKGVYLGMWQIKDGGCRIWVSVLFDQELFETVKWEDREPTLIKNIYDPQILNDAERQYIKSILKPFRDKVEFVIKNGSHMQSDATYSDEYLYIKLYDGEFVFPDFEAGKMYVGMELGKKYKLDELEIKYEEETKWIKI